MTTHRGWLYFLQSGPGGPIKIGFTSRHVSARLAVLQVGNPHPLELLRSVPGNREDERKLHARFASARVTGEWFQPSPELLAFIEGVALGYRDVAAYDEQADEWLESVAEYCHLWSTVGRCERLLDAADANGGLRPNDATELLELHEELTQAAPGKTSGSAQFGAKRIGRTLRRISAALQAMQKGGT